MTRPPKTRPPMVSGEPREKLNGSDESGYSAVWIVEEMLNYLFSPNFLLNVLFVLFLVICFTKLALIALDFYALFCL